jgi:hypothetical protein
MEIPQSVEGDCDDRAPVVGIVEEYLRVPRVSINAEVLGVPLGTGFHQRIRLRKRAI